MTTLDGTHDQLFDAGLHVERLEIDGRLHKCAVDTDKGSKRSGWYVLHALAGRIYGAYGNYKISDEVTILKMDWKGLSEADREEGAERMKAIRAAAEAEQTTKAMEAAKRAADIWEGLPDSGSSSYLQRKRVGAFGVRFARGSVVIPVRSVKDRLRGLQFIAADGSKRFLTGTRKRGAMHRIGSAGVRPLVLAEGYATAASVYMASGLDTVVCFDKGNLEPVLAALMKQAPLRRYWIAADNDTETAGNPGLEMARRAADKHGALVVLATGTPV